MQNNFLILTDTGKLKKLQLITDMVLIYQASLLKFVFDCIFY